MERRDFFRFGMGQAVRSLLQSVTPEADRMNVCWFRPPFALQELEFQRVCTRCDQCLLACPHQVIYRLPQEFGPHVSGTPALRLLAQGCHQCSGWPCVAVCEPGALRLPTPLVGEPGGDNPATIPLPRLARAAIDTRHCLPYQGPECGACASVCPVPGALIWKGTRPTVEEEHCTGCALCREACVSYPKAVVLQPVPSLAVEVDHGCV